HAYEIIGKLCRPGQRLLDECVLAGLQHLSSEIVVGVDWRRDDDGIHGGIGQYRRDTRRGVRRGVASPELLQMVSVEIADPTNLCVWIVAQDAQQIGAPVAKPDDSDVQRSRVDDILEFE